MNYKQVLIANAEQMTLGGLIRALSERPQDDDVYYDFGYFSPSSVGSYRGYYDQLAIGYEELPYPQKVVVSDFLAQLKDAKGKEFTGYKGGEYVMGDDTPIWVANYSQTPSVAIVGIVDCEWKTVLATAFID